MGDCRVQGGGRAAARWVIAMHDIGNMIGIEIGNIIWQVLDSKPLKASNPWSMITNSISIYTNFDAKLLLKYFIGGVEW